MEDKIRTMTTFLDALENIEAIFGLLHKMIYERYPGQGQGKGKDKVIVSAPSSPQLHTVSELGEAGQSGGRVRIVGTTADVVGEALQCIFGLPSLP